MSSDSDCKQNDSCCASKRDAGAASSSPETAVAASGNSYTIEGMDCGACAVTLEKHMGRLAAVQEVSVNFAAGKMQIVHGMTERELLGEVSKAGFTALPRLNAEKSESKKKAAFRAERRRRLFSGARLSGILLFCWRWGSEFLSLKFRNGRPP